eukprot:TRINITY_DN2453_c0_g1_i4.p1 TRINITY_DN2453_c0_g1~~TRINITY_DN2453_c0_g1_i4.p1  ORF type:complete len:159 (+),score=8.08 TRINITY_DN2453_c0_g1_i4:48-524(+)
MSLVTMSNLFASTSLHLRVFREARICVSCSRRISSVFHLGQIDNSDFFFLERKLSTRTCMTFYFSNRTTRRAISRIRNSSFQPLIRTNASETQGRTVPDSFSQAILEQQHVQMLAVNVLSDDVELVRINILAPSSIWRSSELRVTLKAYQLSFPLRAD